MSKCSYLCIHFKDHLNRVNLDLFKDSGGSDLNPNLELELELVVDYRKERLPIGMCPFLEISGKQYLVGGERVRKVPRPSFSPLYEYDYQLDWEVVEPSDALSSDVFVLDPSVGKITVDPSFPKPNAAKTKAKVLATIDRKVYVLGFQGYHYFHILPSPAFECFDMDKNRWEALPAPPNYYHTNRSTRDIVSNYCFHFVAGRKIYLRTLETLFCFNVDEPSKEWERFKNPIWHVDKGQLWSASKEVDRIRGSVPFPPAYPYNSICFSTPPNPDECPFQVAVAYTTMGLMAYLVDDDAKLVYQDVLHELNARLPSMDQDRMMFDGKVVSGGASNHCAFCLILSGMISKPHFSLAVAYFELRPVSWEGQYCFVTSQFCYHEFDDIDSIDNNRHEDEKNYKFPTLYSYYDIQDAFTMDVESESEPKGKQKRRRR